MFFGWDAVRLAEPSFFCVSGRLPYEPILTHQVCRGFPIHADSRMKAGNQVDVL